MVTRPRKFDWDEAAKLYAETRNYAEAARILGVSTQAVRFAVIPDERAKHREYFAQWQREHRPADGICPDCGGVSSMGRYRPNSRCRACHAKHAATSVRPSTLRCCLCRLWLTDDAFGPAKRHPHRRGRHIECKSCQAARKRDERMRRGEEYRAYERDRKRAKRALQRATA